MNDPYAPWVVALTHSGFGDGILLSGRDWWPLFDPPPTSPGEIEARMMRSPNSSFEAIFERRKNLESELEAFEDQGVVAMTMFDRAYPTAWTNRLGPRLPPVIFCLGSREILSSPSVAIVGSRNADESALAFTADVAREAVRRGKTIVTGGAGGVDHAAAAAAVRAGGQAIVIAADSLSEIQRRLLKSDLDLDQVLILTPNHPESGFSVGKAMGRNKLIYALAETAVVSACEANSGGTWTGSTEAIKMAYCPVCVWTGPDSPPGNRALAGAGGRAIESVEAAFEAKEPAVPGSLFD